MNIKALLFSTFAAVLGGSAFGATVSDVFVQPRWPWDTKVDVHFVLSGADGAYDVTPSITAGGESVTVAEGSLSGDLSSLGNGAHTLTWDPSALGQEKLENLQVSLALEPSKTYLLINLASGLGNTSARISYTNRVIGTGTQWDDLYKTQYIVMKRVKAGSFLMGAGSAATRQTTLTKDFYLGVYEMTQKQWKNAGDSYPYSSTDGYTFHLTDADTRPVSRIGYGNVRNDSTWSGTNTVAQNRVVTYGFIKKIRDLTGGKHLFDLPTEAQWEYAARAGSTTLLPDNRTRSAAELDLIARYGNKTDPSESDPNKWSADYGTAKVGTYAPNAWGFYDMIGNAAEWCADWSNGAINGTELKNQTIDPMGAALSSDMSRMFRVVRGGNWSLASTADALTCAGRASAKASSGFRKEGSNYIGVRLCLTVEPESILE